MIFAALGNLSKLSSARFFFAKAQDRWFVKIRNGESGGVSALFFCVFLCGENWELRIEN